MNATPTRTFAFAFFVLGLASTAHAANGTVDLTWGNICSPIVTHISTTTPEPQSIIASVFGSDQTHLGYQVRLLIGSPSLTVPDAWRFDAAGCQTPALMGFQSSPPAAAAKTCPAFKGPNPLEITNYDFMIPGTPYPTSVIRTYLACVYPAGATANPAQRYFLVRFLFDHTFSVVGPTTPGVNCGGYETPMVVRLLHDDPSLPGGQPTSYVRASDGIELPFDVGVEFLSFNGAVPANATTWGQVKNAYRR